MKLFIRNTLLSVGIAAVIFCAVFVIIELISRGELHLTGYAFTKMALGTLAVGLGFGAPTFIYAKDSVPLVCKIVFHMGIGCAVYIATAFLVGWIPTSFGLGACLLTIAGQLFGSFCVWLGFYLYHRKLAKKINEKLRNP